MSRLPSWVSSGRVAALRRALTLRRSEALLVGGSVVVLALLTADVAADGLLTYLDGELRAWLEPPVDAGWADVVGGAGDLGVAVAILAISMLVTLHATWRLWPLLLGAGNVVAMGAAVLALKSAVGRVGPGETVDPPGYPGHFPSGHTATSAVCVGTAVFLLLALSSGAPRDSAGRWGLVAGLSAGLLVGAVSVLGDFHWLTDAVGGLLVATIVLVVGFAMARGYAEEPVDVPHHH